MAPGILGRVTYEVQTAVFEGPFDLLLHLIARQQVDLYEVSLATIVDAYLAELDKMAGLDLEVATEFLLIAATLVELKTRRLLPVPDDVDLDDDLALLEERDLLLTRLVECKTFRDAGAALARLSDVAACSVPRTTGPDDRFLALEPDLLAGVVPADLARALARLCTPKPVPRIDLDHVAPIRVSVGDAIEELVATLPEAGRVTFRGLTAGVSDRLQVIVRFLAVLELYKQGLVEVDQSTTFGELGITWLGAVDGQRPASLVSADVSDG